MPGDSDKCSKTGSTNITLESSQIFMSNRARPSYERDLAQHKKRVAEQIASAEGRPVVRMYDPMGQCELVGVLIRENPKTLVVAPTSLLGNQEQEERRIHKSRCHTEPCTRCPDHPAPVIHPTLRSETKKD